MASSWSARACSGDAAAALLQPHQLLLSVEDAALRGVRQLDLVRVCFASRGSVLLQCVVGGGQAGRVQLHAWVLDVCGQLEDAATTLQKVEPSGDAASWRLRFSVLTKFPPVATAGADGTAQLGESRADLLPLSVRQRHVDLEKAVARQLRAMGTLRAPQTGQLVPVKLLGDTFVFRVDAAERTEAQHSQVVVTGWSDEDSVRLADTATAELTEQVAALSIQDTTGSSYESELDARLWQTGFVGYTAFLQDVLLNLALVLKRGQKNLDNDVEMEQIGSHGLLVSGVNGVGKSLALAALQRELAREKIRTWRVDGMSLLMGAESPAFPTAFEYLTYELEKHFPEFGSLNDLESEGSFVGVVLIDDLDVLFQSADGQTADGSDTQLPQLGSALLRLIDELSSRNARLVIVGATSSADANVPLVAKRTGRFGKVLDLVVPTEQTRRDILERHLNGLPRQSDEGTPIKTNARNLSSRLAAITGGYVAKDLVRICRNAAAQVHAESSDNHGCTKLSVGWNELLRAQQQIKPSQLRELNVASPGATIDGKLAFAGYAAVQKQLFDFISWKFHPTAAMNRLGISNASGILLSGPSGCGKTLLVQTLAAQAQVNFVSVKSSELLSKYFGDSEKAVRQLFAQARAAAPCLLFFDEFDSIAHKRSFGEGDGGSSGGGVYARVLSTFLNEMDGVGSQRVSASSVSHAKGESPEKSGGILVVAATNRKDALDAALIRPGRIDKTVELGFPTEEDIQDMLALYTRKMPLAADVDIQTLAARPRGSRNFTGADVAAVCKEAAFRALREDIEAKTISLRHFEDAWDQRTKATATYKTPTRANLDTTTNANS